MGDETMNVVVAGYPDIGTARHDFDALIDRVKDKAVASDGVILVAKDDDGNVTLSETGAHLGRRGAGWGDGVGAVVGLLAPPLLASVAIGASTGGTHAIQEILQAMPAGSPPILIVQHMPENFSKPLASRLDAACEITVKEAEDGEPILPGHAYIGPGDLHFLIRRTDAPKRYIAHLAQAEAVNLHRPSVDILFRSAAKRVGAGATGVLLTGGGKDGAEGLLEIKQAGGRTIVQDEATCVVFGMPREAIALGAAMEVLSLSSIARRLQAGPGNAS